MLQKRMDYNNNFVFSKLLFLSLLALFFLTNSFAAQNDVQVDFSSPSTQTLDVEFSNSNVEYFSFSLVPEELDSSYPSNVILDIGADGSHEWEISNVASQTPLEISELEGVSSTSNPTHIDFQSNLGVDSSGNSFGNLQGSSFSKSVSQNQGSLGITTIHDIESQRLQISTPSGDILVYLPEITNLMGTAGFYISESGDSYYCNSDHNFYLVQGCDLSVQEAMVEKHLAASAPNSFQVAQKISSQGVLSSVNQYLDSCSSFPCMVPFEISSSTKGSLVLRNFSTVYDTPTTNIPAEITLAETSNNYDVTITPGSALKEVSYFYGVSPQVIIAPVLAGDDSINYGAGERTFFDFLESDFANRWDSMTENKFPLNIHLAQKPIYLSNYDISQDDYGSFIDEAKKEMLDMVPDESQPFILVVVDINNYFPQKEPQNSLFSYSKNELTHISTIYLNGFDETSDFYDFDEYFSLIQPNILLHELAHTFIQYSGDSNYFYETHPTSFTDSTILRTQTITQSPENQESYYELYSILNQFRPYIKDSEVGGSPQLSSLDKLLMGIKNVYEPAKYKLYSASVENTGSQLEVSSISKIEEVDAIPLFNANQNLPWWSIVSDSPRNSQGTSTSFSVSKSSQDSRALWVVANDAVFTNNYRVFSNNAESQMNVLSELDEVPEVDVLTSLGVLSSNVSSLELDVETQISSSCRFSNSSQNGYSNMEFEFSTSNGLEHNYLLENLSTGSSYSYFVLCESNQNGLMSNKVQLDFSVGSSQNQTQNSSDSDTDSPSDSSESENLNSSGGGSSSGSSSGGSSSSGGGGGSGSSSSSTSRSESSQNDEDLNSILQKESTNKCYSNFTYYAWSSCEGGVQERKVVDQAGCVDDSIQTRSCELDLSEEEIKKLNAKKYELTKRSEKTYGANLVGSYNELFYSSTSLPEKEFILIDETTGDQYLAEYFEENQSQNRTYYSLNKVYGNGSLTSDVERQTIIENQSHPVFENILKGITLLLIMGFVLVVVRFILKS